MNDVFTVTAFTGLAAAIAAGWFTLRLGRIVYWIGAATVTVSVFFMAYPPDWRSALTMSALAACATVGVAYANTQYISVRGKTYSLFADPNTIDDYGIGLTAAKTWWLAFASVVLLSSVGAVSIVNDSPAWIPAGAAVMIVFAALSMGYRDALAARRVAAGQKIQLGLLSAATLGIFPAVYFGAYRAGGKRNTKSPAVE